jgi:hypothetical protein
MFMATTGKTVITRKRGTTIDIQTQILDRNNAPLVLDNYNVTFEVYAPGAALPSISKAATITSSSNGTVLITLVKTDTQNMSGDVQFCIIVAHKTDTSIIHAASSGILRLTNT